MNTRHTLRIRGVFGKRRLVCSTAAAAAVLLGGCSSLQTAGPGAQPVIGARVKPVLKADGLQFKDLNGNGRLDAYEDWRRPVSERIENLLAQMTPEEKAGMMLIQTLNSAPGGQLDGKANKFVNDEHMTRFIFRNPVVPVPDPNFKSMLAGPQITVRDAAEFTNRVQALAEGSRLGIPVVFKSNARNHYEQDARPGINVAAGSFSAWPKEAGLAATRDMKLVADFGETMRQEWTSIGVHGMYGYMADLGTEPRWYRVHETFTEDADLAADIIRTLVTTLQGKELNPGSVALTIKHFPGGGPQEGGGDPHYWFGRDQTYPSGNFNYHLKPFKAAIDAGSSSIMAYYGIPVGQQYQPNDVGMAFSKGILTKLLKDELGFKGYVNSDTGIIGPPGVNRAWGLDGKSMDEQLRIAIDAGTDVFSGFDSHELILNLVKRGAVSQQRVDQSVRQLLREQFQLGLFENPYCDPDVAVNTVGKAEFKAKADAAQRRSMVLLQNTGKLLPLAAQNAGGRLPVYTMGVSKAAAEAAGFAVTTGDHAADAARPPIPAGTRHAIIRVNIGNPVLPLTDPREPQPLPGMSPRTIFGGALPEEINNIALSDMVGTKSWTMTPSLADIQAVMREVGAENTVLAIYFRQPYVLDEASGVRKAGALIGLFGADDAALMDVITGRASPGGKLPFSLANSAAAVLRHPSDAPGYPPADTLYPFGFGLSY